MCVLLKLWTVIEGKAYRSLAAALLCSWNLGFAPRGCCERAVKGLEKTGDMAARGFHISLSPGPSVPTNDADRPRNTETQVYFF